MTWEKYGTIFLKLALQTAIESGYNSIILDEDLYNYLVSVKNTHKNLSSV